MGGALGAPLHPEGAILGDARVRKHRQKLGVALAHEAPARRVLGREERAVVGAINESLGKALGSDYSLAVRVCLNTSLALSDPSSYRAALVEIVGRQRAEEAMRLAEARLRRLGEPGSGATRFSRLVFDLRSRYSADTLEDGK